MTLIFIVGLASQIWCLLNPNQVGTWQKNVPLNNALSYMVLYEIFHFWENMETLRWYGPRQWPSLWSVISIFLLCTPSCSILPVWAVCWRPFLPGFRLSPTQLNLGLGHVEYQLQFLPCVFLAVPGHLLWKLPLESCSQYPAKEGDRILMEGEGHGAPARPAQSAAGARAFPATTQPVKADCHQKHPWNYTFQYNLCHQMWWHWKTLEDTEQSFREQRFIWGSFPLCARC